MSMIRAQEYFAPLRSRHISLQQWERGLLFESWGSSGGRADRQRSGELNDYLATPDLESEQEFGPVKKVIARSVSFSASTVGSEPVKTKNFARGLSFPRSLASKAEIIPEESDYCTTRRSNADLSPMFAAQASPAYLFPRSVESGRVESEISESSCQVSEDSSETFSSDGPAELDPRPLPRRFFSGGLSFSRDKKFLSGVLSFSKDKKFFSGSLSLPKPCLEPCGRTLDRSQSWGVNDSYDIPSLDHKNTAARRSTETRLKNRFLSKVLSFSRSLDSKGEVPSEYSSKSNGRTEIRRGLSFSRSLDPGGEIPGSEYISRSNGRCPEIQRGLSFSRSLDVNGELLSSDDCCDSGSSSNSGRVPELTWSKKFISRSGLFFSKQLSPRRGRENPSDISGSETCSEKPEHTEVRSKKFFGRGFSLSFSRFLDPQGDASSVNSGGTNGSGKADKESHFKRFFTRGFLFSSSKSVDPADQPSSGAACDTPASSTGNSTKSYSKRFFSKEWSWSRSKSRTTSPAKNSSNETMGNSRNLFSTDESESSRADSNPAPSSSHSQALKNWWSKRTGVSSKSVQGNDQNSRLVLLEKVPAVDDKESNDLTVYVGERGETLTKYVLAKHILRHHLFQVLLKCSQDELGSDHDYGNGVPIICDPALFLQLARAVGGNFSSETTLCRC